MARGRPVGSAMRQNVVEILAVLEKGYGYQIAKIYNEIFEPVTQRSIYYHLRKGVITREFELEEIKSEKGQFSWGESCEKTYYSLGKEAKPRGNAKVEEFVTQWVKGRDIKKKEPVKEMPKETTPKEVVRLPGVFTRIARKFRKEK